MSHRVTTESSMTDLSIVQKVAKAQGFSFNVTGETVQFTSGKLNRASLDTRTGRITGDTDFGHTQDALGMLRQAYSEEKYRQECLKQGIQIEDRTVLSQHNGQKGVVKLTISMG
jgi:hypothetical protein